MSMQTSLEKLQRPKVNVAHGSARPHRYGDHGEDWRAGDVAEVSTTARWLARWAPLPSVREPDRVLPSALCRRLSTK